PDDPVIVVNSFSKAWCMTGWRVGWITAPARIGPEIEKLIEFNYSCPVDFVQHAAVTAIEEGEDFVAEIVERYRQARDLVYQRLAACKRVSLVRPEAAFYAFMAVDGMTDSTEFAKRILADHGVGLAPGEAFGPGGEGHLRLCFASAPETLSRALDRLEVALEA
ncbi:MAG: aminotransferase class I/II-fold pyridoxal phosphate-dependent enzyme, partial [Alphaproteobacteria bacterium]